MLVSKELSGCIQRCKVFKGILQKSDGHVGELSYLAACCKGSVLHLIKEGRGVCQELKGELR